MRLHSRLLCLSFATVLLSSSAWAQQGVAPVGNELARVEVRFAELEERLRKIQGNLEELEYENRRLRETVERSQQDTNMRLTDLENAKPLPVAADDEPEEETTEKATPAKAEEPAAATKKAASSVRATPREQYDHAFRLLNQTQYEEAGQAFDDFIETFPTDPLIGNAYYWAAETHYVRQDYAQAANYFKRGYETLPAGPKAADNLLKLGMSLNNLKRTPEACVVLRQVAVKFGATSGSIKNKAEQERTRAGCK